MYIYIYIIFSSLSLYLSLYIYIYIYMFSRRWIHGNKHLKLLEKVLTSPGFKQWWRSFWSPRLIQEGTSSVRLVSVPDFSFENSSVRFGSVRFGSVRFGQNILPIRCDSACVFRTRRGTVGSVRFRVRFRPLPELNGSVRLGSAGSVWFLIPSCKSQ